MNTENKSKFEQYKEAFSIIEECIEGYVFVYDLTKDYISVSKSVLENFELGEFEFGQAKEHLKTVIHEQDWEKFISDIQAISNHEKSFHNMEYRMINKKGEVIWVYGRGRVTHDENGNATILAGCITELGKHNKYDNVTSLYCEDVLKEEYLWWSLSQEKTGHLLLVGIDNFRGINEKYGSKTGDEILSQVADIIVDCCGGRKQVYRFNGDEFAVVTKSEKGECAIEAKRLYNKIKEAVENSIEKQLGYHMFFTVSAGAVEFDAGTDSYDSVSKKARFALHSAKQKGKNNFTFYSEEDYQAHIRKIDIQEELRKSIENNFAGFVVYYQPIMNPETNTLYGSEALIRWDSEKYGFMSPVDFIPLLEESSLIIPLGRWIIESAVKQCSEWVKIYPDYVMNINLSFVQILKSDVLKDAVELMESYGLDHKHIVFEVTESGELESNSAVKNVLSSFNDKRFSLAIDDFGTGYSNLRYIRDMMFGIIKIDRLFVKDINESSENYTLVKYVTEMAHNFNIKVCVEGVETQEEYDKIMTLNPDCIQGFFYGKPMNAKDFKDKYMNEDKK